MAAASLTGLQLRSQPHRGLGACSVVAAWLQCRPPPRLPRRGRGACSMVAAWLQCRPPPRSRVYLRRGLSFCSVARCVAAAPLNRLQPRPVPHSCIYLATGAAFAASLLQGGSVAHIHARASISPQASICSGARCLARMTASPRAWLLQRRLSMWLRSVAHYLAHASTSPHARPQLRRIVQGCSVACHLAMPCHGSAASLKRGRCMAAVAPAPYGARRQRCMPPCSRVCLATGSASTASRLHGCSVTRRLARSVAPPRCAAQ
jgi:hypothetical protein